MSYIVDTQCLYISIPIRLLIYNRYISIGNGLVCTIQKIISSNKIQVLQNKQQQIYTLYDFKDHLCFPDNLDAFPIFEYLTLKIGEKIVIKTDAQINKKTEIYLETDQHETLTEKALQIKEIKQNHKKELCLNTQLNMFVYQINDDGTLALYDQSTQNIINFEPQYIKIIILGPYYQQNLEQILIKQNILYKYIPVILLHYQKDLLTQKSKYIGQFEHNEFFLEQGFAMLQDEAYLQIEDQSKLQIYDKLQTNAQHNLKGIWEKQIDFISIVNRLDQFTAIVREIEYGNLLIVERLGEKSENYQKIQLTRISCPQGQEQGAFEAREFTRKACIGKEVDIYLEKEKGQINDSGVVVISENQQNLNLMLIKAGFSRLKPEYKDVLQQENEWKKSKQYEEEAIIKKLGIHNNNIGITNVKEIGVKETLQLYNVQIKDRMRKEHYQCVVEKVVSAEILSLRFITFNVIVKVKLFGIKAIKDDPNQPFLNKMHQKAKIFSYNSLMNRNVVFDIISFQNKYLIGRIFIDKKVDFAQILLEEGLVQNIEECETYDNSYQQIEEKAKKIKKGIWEQELAFQLENREENLLSLTKKNSSQSGTRIKVKVEQIEDAERFYLVMQENELQEKINEKIDSYGINKLQNLQKSTNGSLCIVMRQKDQLLYRAKIIKKLKNKMCDLEYIDYGFTEQANSCELFQMPNELLKYEAQSQICRLAYIKVPFGKHKMSKETKQYFEKKIDEKNWEAEFVFQGKNNKVNNVILYENNGQFELENSLNLHFVHAGFARIDQTLPNNPLQDEIFLDIQYQAQQEYIGLWNPQNFDRLSEEEEEYEDEKYFY